MTRCFTLSVLNYRNKNRRNSHEFDNSKNNPEDSTMLTQAKSVSEDACMSETDYLASEANSDLCCEYINDRVENEDMNEFRQSISISETAEVLESLDSANM